MPTFAPSAAADKAIVLGDPVPWFGAPLVGEGAFNLQVAAGRWIVLSFLGSPDDPQADRELTQLLADTHIFDEDKIIFCGLFTAAALRCRALYRDERAGDRVPRRLRRRHHSPVRRRAIAAHDRP